MRAWDGQQGDGTFGREAAEKRLASRVIRRETTTGRVAPAAGIGKPPLCGRRRHDEDRDRCPVQDIYWVSSSILEALKPRTGR